MKSKTIHVRVDNDLHKKLVELAKADSRPISTFVLHIVKSFINGLLKWK